MKFFNKAILVSIALALLSVMQFANAETQIDDSKLVQSKSITIDKSLDEWTVYRVTENALDDLAASWTG